MATLSSNTTLAHPALSVNISSINSINFEGTSLFEPDIIVPGHFLSSENGGSKDGERRLMAALLSDGIEAYITQASGVSVDSRRQKGKFDAAEWIETTDSSYVFSFDNVCASLGINPQYLRLGLGRYLKTAKTFNTEEPVWKKIRRPRKRA